VKALVVEEENKLKAVAVDIMAITAERCLFKIIIIVVGRWSLMLCGVRVDRMEYPRSSLRVEWRRFCALIDLKGCFRLVCMIVKYMLLSIVNFDLFFFSLFKFVKSNLVYSKTDLPTIFGATCVRCVDLNS